MLKRLFAVLGCVLLVITCFVVPVSAAVPVNNQVSDSAPIALTPIGYFTNSPDGIDVTSNFYFVDVDGLAWEPTPNTIYYYWTGNSLGYFSLYASKEFEYPMIVTVNSGYGYSFEADYDDVDQKYFMYESGSGYWGDAEILVVPIYAGSSGSGYETGYAEGYNDGYGEGYSDGESQGDANGYARGYSVGLAEGDANGYARGYAEGLENGSGITWTGLFTSAIEVPVNVLQGILNFEILGVNLWSFFGAIVALCVVLIVVKWVI